VIFAMMCIFPFRKAPNNRPADLGFRVLSRIKGPGPPHIGNGRNAAPFSIDLPSMALHGSVHEQAFVGALWRGGAHPYFTYYASNREYERWQKNYSHGQLELIHMRHPHHVSEYDR
jgi:hypothetical protein